MIRRRAAAVSFAFALSSATARADDPPPPRSPELTVAVSELELFREQVKKNHAASSAGALVAAGITLPTGIVLLTRDSSEETAIGSAVTLSSVFLVGEAFVASLFSDSLEKVHDAHEARRARGMSEVDLLSALEKDWQEAATKSRKTRIGVGALEVLGGLTVTLAGAVLLLAPPILGMSRRGQSELGAGALGFAVPVVATGVHEIIDRSPTELSWEAYSRAKARGATVAFAF